MKRVLFLFLCFALLVLPLEARRRWTPRVATASASFTYHDSQTVLTTGSGTTRTRTVTVSTGDLVVVYATNLSGSTITSVTGSDTVHSDTFTALTAQTGSSSNSGQFWYVLASNCSTGTGTYTITVTYNASSIYRGVNAYTFTPSSACSYDTEGGAHSVANDTAIATTSVSVASATNLVFCGSVESNGTRTSSSQQIGGVSASTNAISNTNTTFYRTGSSLGSVTGTGTWSANTAHCEQLAAFKI